MDLLTIFRILYKRRYYIIGLPLAALLLTFLLTFGYKKTYKSTAQLSTGYTVSSQVDPTNERFNLFEIDVKFNNLIETFNSPRVLSLAAYETLIHDLNNPKKAFRKIDIEDKEKLNFEGLNKDSLVNQLAAKIDSIKLLDPYSGPDQRIQEILELHGYDIQSLKKNITVNRVKNTDFVSITAYTENPNLSAFLVNSIGEQFLRFNYIMVAARSDETVQSLEKLVQQKRKELDNKLEQLRRYKSSNQVLDFTIESESKIAKIAEYETKRQDEIKNKRALQTQLSDINARINSANESKGSNTYNRITDLSREIGELNQRYINTGSSDPVLRDSLNMLRGLYQNLVSSSSPKTDNLSLDELQDKKREIQVELNISDQNINAIDEILSNLKRNVGGYASKEATISQLEREVELASEEYRNTQEKYNKSLDVAASRDSDMKIVLYGQPATDPEPSKRLIVTGLSTFSTLILVILIFLFVEYIDVSLKSPSNFRKQVDLKLLGTLNKLNLKKVQTEHLFSEQEDELQPDASLVLYQENLRKIRHEFQSFKQKIILFTSTKPREGKTTIIKSLATANAKSSANGKTLLIDLNFPNNSLSQSENVDDNIHKIIKKSSKSISIGKTGESIHKLGCESSNGSPSEILDMQKFAQFLEKVRNQYDFIFIESASMNNYSDARELSEYVDGIVLVFSAESTLKQMDRESIEFVQNQGAKNYGAILNNVEEDNMDS